MAMTKIKYYQLDLTGKIVNADIATNAAIATSKLADGAMFFWKDGSVQATGNFDMNNHTLNNLPLPTQAGQAASKAYVDAVKQALDIKDSVRVATTSNISISSAPASIDGYTLVSGDRILVKNQSTASENGIWVFNGVGSALTRAIDADVDAEVTLGMYTYIEYGTQAGSGWVLSSATADPIVLGTTGITFTQFNGAGQINAGAGLTKTGNTIDVVTASSTRIVVNADSIDLATIAGLVAGTYGDTGANVIQATVDAYGRVTAISNRTLTAGNIGAQPASTALDNIVAFNGTGYAVRKVDGSWIGRTFTTTGSGITLTNADGTAGNTNIALSSNLSNFSAISATGVLVRDSGGNFFGRTVTGTTGRITVANGDGTTANPTIDLATITVTGTTGLVRAVDTYGRVSNVSAITVSDLPASVQAASKFIHKEVPTGSVDGVNTAFTLANPYVVGTEYIYVNGVLMKAGGSNDYSTNGPAGTFTFTFTPQIGDVIQVSYQMV